MNTQPMSLPDGAKYILEKYLSVGHDAYIVGGAVRNHLLGLPIYDYDITTSATPEETKELFSLDRIVDTGIRHGTVTLVLDDGQYEITTFRTDGEYLDNRHPSSICFSRSLDDDLSRRDFTVNAMCYNDAVGFVDRFSGMADIRAGLIRAVGEPAVRFSEDALRILRALRFASTLGFRIEKETAAAILEKKELLSSVSRERIFTEWRKILEGSGAYDILKDYKGVISVIIPELEGLELPQRDKFSSAEWYIRQLGLFLASSEDPVSSFGAAMRSLRADNFRIRQGVAALSCLLSERLDTTVEIKTAIYHFGTDAVRDAISLGILTDRLSAENMKALDSVIDSGEPTSLSALEIDGRELISLGFVGEAVGRALDRLMLAVIRGECPNKREALVEYISGEALR